MKPCCSRAAWYSAFSFRSPWARASAIALITAGRLTDFSSLEFRAQAPAPFAVMGRGSCLLLHGKFLVQFLQREHVARAAVVQRAQQRARAGHGGGIGDALLQGLAPDREGVGDGLPPSVVLTM